MKLPMILLALSLAGAGAGTEQTYTEDDLWVLSHIINAEAGDSNCPHDLRIAVGSVVLNRVESDEFPDSIRDVVYQSGQYAPTWNGSMEKEPSEDSVEVAQMLLEDGSQIPDECVFQAEFPQGSGVYESFDTVYGTTYICYR